VPVQVRHINYVIAAADHGSFRRAAAALCIHESAISRRIRDLEIRLGAALFVRSAGGVHLTQAGRVFVQRGRQALTQIGLAKSEVGAIGRGDAGEIRIGVFSAVGGGFLSELISAFGAAVPAVRMTFVDGDQAEHIGALRRGDLDVAFVTGNAEWP
jgi:DNA-binding transcriptional LysR family regulator